MLRDPRGLLAFALASAIWGSTFLAIAIGNDTMPPFWAASLRLLIAFALLCGIMLATRTAVPRGAGLRAAAGYGALEFGVNFGLLYWGEQFVSSGIAAVLFATIPLSTAVLARAAGLERFTPRKVVAALVAFGGVVIIFWGEVGADVPLLPLVGVFVAATGAALAGVVLKRAPPQSPIATNAVGVAVGAVILLPVSVIVGEPRALPDSFAAWWPILYLAVAGSVVAFVAFVWLINRWTVTSASLVSLVIPVVAVTLGALVRDESFGLATLAGAALVLIGVAVALRSE